MFLSTIRNRKWEGENVRKMIGNVRNWCFGMEKGVAFCLRKKMRQIGADGFTGKVEFVIF